MTKEQIDEIAMAVWNETESECDSRTGRQIITDFTHALLAELAKVQEPFGYYENGRWSIVTDGGPEGYQLVPIEPTEAMIQAGKDVPCEAKYGSDVVRDSDYVRVFKAMLSAKE